MRRVIFRNLIEIVTFLAVYWLLTYDGPPLRQMVWFKVSRTCQFAALAFGRAGLHAERRYHLSTQDA